MAAFSGLNHNIIKTKDGRLYRWGGDSKYKGSDTKNVSPFKFMYEFKGKRTSNIQSAQNNTIVVSHLKMIKDDTIA
jgi:alpha-tubulin suppressor-like RCC1 family protein